MARLRRVIHGFLLVALFVVLGSMPFAAVSNGGDDDEVGVVEGDEVGVVEGDEVGIVGENVDNFFASTVVESAPGVKTVFYFPKNPEKVIAAGETTEILVGISNFGESPLAVSYIRASISLPYDHRIFVQNFTVQEFFNSTVPSGIQASFPYSFTVSKYLQPGRFDLVASIFYEIGDQPYRTTFHNGTVEVVEAHGLFSGETLFLVTLGLGLTALFGIWAHGQVQNFSKRARRSKKVETGTRTTDAASNEWLQGTAFTAKRSSSISQTTRAKRK